jgi:hypothetical protein
MGCDGPRATLETVASSERDAASEPPPPPEMDAAVRDATPPPSEAAVPEAGETAPVLVGLAPLSLTTPDPTATAADSVQAHVDVIASGARAVTLGLRWNELVGDDGAPIERAWDDLARGAALYRDAERSVLVSLTIVDRTLDVRPQALGGSWGASELDAFESLVGAVYEIFDGSLRYLSVGHRVDQWLAAASRARREELTEFVLESLERARGHRRHPPGVEVGVSLSFEGLMSDDVPEVAELAAASDAVFVSYLPFDDASRARPAESVSADLEGLLERFSGADGESARLVLEQIGYPSHFDVDASPERQRAFFDALFRTVAQRRERIPFITVFSFNDLPREVCVATAVAQGLSPGSGRYSRLRDGYCSLGLRERIDADDVDAPEPAGVIERPRFVEKPAWRRVLDAFATFQAP